MLMFSTSIGFHSSTLWGPCPVQSISMVTLEFPVSFSRQTTFLSPFTASSAARWAQVPQSSVYCPQSFSLLTLCLIKLSSLNLLYWTATLPRHFFPSWLHHLLDVIFTFYFYVHLIRVGGRRTSLPVTRQRTFLCWRWKYTPEKL